MYYNNIQCLEKRKSVNRRGIRHAIWKQVSCFVLNWEKVRVGMNWRTYRLTCLTKRMVMMVLHNWSVLFKYRFLATSVMCLVFLGNDSVLKVTMMMHFWRLRPKDQAQHSSVLREAEKRGSLRWDTRRRGCSELSLYHHHQECFTQKTAAF